MEDTPQIRSSENKYVDCVIQSHLFGGFTQMVNLNAVESIDEIIGTVISTLHSVLNYHNLKGLTDHLEMITFTVEKITYDDIITGKVNKVVITGDDYSLSDEDD